MQKLMTVPQLCEWLQVDRDTVYRLVRSGRLPHMRVGSQLRFDQQDVDRWMREGSATNGRTAVAAS